MKKKFIFTMVGLLLIGFTYNMVLTENYLNLGGVVGLAQSADRMGFSYTLSLITLNLFFFIPVFADAFKDTFGWQWLGWKDVFSKHNWKSIISKKAWKELLKERGWKSVMKNWIFPLVSFANIIALGRLLDVIPKIEPQIPFEVSLFGGSVLAGIGFGLVCRAAFSTGGVDMVGFILRKNGCNIAYGGLSLGDWMTIMDEVVIIIWFFVTGFNAWVLLTSMLAMRLCNVAVDVAEGADGVWKRIAKEPKQLWGLMKLHLHLTWNILCLTMWVLKELFGLISLMVNYVGRRMGSLKILTDKVYEHTKNSVAQFFL